ncbi:right-handed parallel beta-helix repeat-containing protein [Flavobacterium ovatum]|uniref:right-handed parallel beta-helix repeat-containing protein n=1 Tax=Flavobacterium ovatum TaxID=1928857 RepID=UPI00344D0AFE
MKKNYTLLKQLNLLVILLIMHCSVFSQTNYYVSATGNDANNGTSSGTAWKTLAKVNSQSFTAGSIINFESGSVFNGNLTISGKTGTSSNPIIYKSYGTGSKPVIRASATIGNWTLVSSNVWKTTLGLVGGKRLASLYLNNTAQQIGREPNYNTTDGGFRVIKSHTSDNLSISENSSLPYPIDYFKGGEITIRTLNDLMKSETISSHSASTVIFTQSSPTSTSENIIRDNFGYFFQNHVNALDQEGEWAHDTTNSTLYLYSTFDPNTLSVEIPSVSYAIEIKNSSKYIEIRNLQFDNGIKNVMNISSISNVIIDGCVFNNGNEYVTLGFTLTDVTFTHNTINDSNSVGVRWEGCSGLTFSNNTITNIGMRAGMGAISYIPYTGVRIISNGTGNVNIIEKNKLDGIGYHGINFAGGNTTVQYNEVANYCAVKDDGGGIYTVNNQNANNLILKNIVHDAPGAFKGNPVGATPKTAGIYVDNNTNNHVISQNTVYNVGAWGIMTNLSGTNTITDNTVFNCGNAIVSSTYNNSFGPGGAVARANDNTVLRNILFTKQSTQYCASFSNQITSADFGTYLGILDFNYYCQPYTGGKEISTKEGGTSKEYLLPAFKSTYSNYEPNGLTAPLKFSIGTNPEAFIRFEVNATDTPIVVSLGNVIYKDAKNVSFSSDITLAAYSSIVLLNTGILLSVDKFGNLITPEKVIVYPNPTSDFLKLEKLTIGDSVKIYTIIGELLSSYKANNEKEIIDVSSLDSGIYLISVGKYFTSKFIKK